MAEVAHMGQEECEETSSSRLHHFVSIISFPGWDSGEVGRHSGDVSHPRMAGLPVNLLPSPCDFRSD